MFAGCCGCQVDWFMRLSGSHVHVVPRFTGLCDSQVDWFMRFTGNVLHAIVLTWCGFLYIIISEVFPLEIL